jgi:hypothetical protein
MLFCCTTSFENLAEEGGCIIMMYHSMHSIPVFPKPKVPEGESSDMWGTQVNMVYTENLTLRQVQASNCVVYRHSTAVLIHFTNKSNLLMLGS